MKDYKGNLVEEGTKLKFKVMCVYGREYRDLPYTIGTVKGSRVIYEDFGREKSFSLESVLGGLAEYLGCNPTKGEVVRTEHATQLSPTNSPTAKGEQ